MVRLTRLAGFILAALILTATPALGAAQGKPGGGGGGSTAWVSASPNPAAAGGTRVDIAGCGYSFALAQVVVTHSAGYSESFSVPMWSSGCMDTAYFRTREAGTYTIEVFQTSGTKRGSPLVLKASTTLGVV